MTFSRLPAVFDSACNTLKTLRFADAIPPDEPAAPVMAYTVTRSRVAESMAAVTVAFMPGSMYLYNSVGECRSAEVENLCQEFSSGHIRHDLAKRVGKEQSHREQISCRVQACLEYD